MSRGASRRQRVVVVGAGLAGLSAACHLAGRGHDVVVMERRDMPGGLAGRVERHGFTFDTGPTVLTMPDLISATIRATGTDAEEFLSLRPLDPSYVAHFADGSTIRVRSGRSAMAEEIRTTCGHRDAAAFHRFCAWAERLYELAMPAFIDRNYDHAWQLGLPPGPPLRLVRAGALRSLHGKVASFFRDERLRRLFSFQALYVGTSPFRARAAYAVVSYMDGVAGVVTPAGGAGAVPAALAAAAEKAGAEFWYETEVEAVVRGDGGAGWALDVLVTSGACLGADAVVITVDRPSAYRRLLPWLPDPATRQLVHSPSALVWHVGVRGRVPAGTGHHNIHFGSAWRDAFDAVLRDGRPMPDPSVLVTVPTVSHPELAPPGGSTLYVLEPVPNLNSGIDWAVVRGRLRDRLAERLSGWGYLGGDIAAEHLVDPTDWAQLGLAAGTPFSLAHTFFQSGPFRPTNVDRRVPGLVFAGSGTVPGVGVPMALTSGRLAAERVEELR